MAQIARVSTDSAAVETFRFEAAGGIPNNSALPAVCLRGVISPVAGPGEIRGLMESNGWTGTWTWTVFDYHHYHPNAHEALIVASGSASLVIGGTRGQGLEVEAGDALILPAGTGHCRGKASSDFRVCGGYPRGQEAYETLRDGDPVTPEIRARISAVPLPVSDPVYGSEGPLFDAWGLSD
ncbi:cupin domain-containing protein [Amaricoccus macauensis]|uniref:cupin domain-containing protein n=1 Tax=Amaricoccus macauensis TaxID=57001 RepID=UPI003C7D9455